MEETNPREHDRMVDILFHNISIIGKALNLPDIFVRGKEYQFDPTSEERADMVFQDHCNPYKPSTDDTCWVMELKSDEADHEVVGQIQKAVDVLTKVGASIRHWGHVRGLAIAKRYTPSGLQLLKNAGFSIYLWSEDKDGVKLVNAIQKRAMPKTA